MLIICVRTEASVLQGRVKVPELAVNKAILCIGNKLVWHYTEKYGNLVNAQVAAAAGKLL